MVECFELIDVRIKGCNLIQFDGLT